MCCFLNLSPLDFLSFRILEFPKLQKHAYKISQGHPGIEKVANCSVIISQI